MTNMTPYTQEQYQAALAELDKCGDNYYSITVHWLVIRHALQAMADPNWVLVPKEPDIKMVQAGTKSNAELMGRNERGELTWYMADLDYTRKVFLACLSAAPTYAAPKEGG